MLTPTSKLGQAYDALFFECMDRDARRSAEVVLPLLAQNLNIRSVIDFGCGNGEWLRVWKELSAQQVVGVDGDFVARESLRIDPTEFLQSRVPAGQSVPDWSSRGYRFRCALSKRQPVKWTDRIVRLAHHIENRKPKVGAASAN